MPIPFVFIIPAAVAALTGVGTAIKASSDLKDANETNSRAQDITERAIEMANLSREATNKALTEFGMQKAVMLDNSMKSFISAFEKLHNIELINTTGMDELQKFKIDQQSIPELKDQSSLAADLLGGAVGGATLGAVTAFGAYTGAAILGVASTGTPIAALSGIAASNATLAFLGGGSLAAGGLGIAGGAAVLGGLVAAPAVAVFGIVMAARASANRDKAYSNLAKAREYTEEIKKICTLCNGIRMRTTLFHRLLLKLNVIFEPLVIKLEKLITEHGTDYSCYTPQQKATVAAGLAIATAIKALLDTPILTKDGKLTVDSVHTADAVQKVIDQYV